VCNDSKTGYCANQKWTQLQGLPRNGGLTSRYRPWIDIDCREFDDIRRPENFRLLGGDRLCGVQFLLRRQIVCLNTMARQGIPNTVLGLPHHRAVRKSIMLLLPVGSLLRGGRTEIYTGELDSWGFQHPRR
jgi:hypothetical protein